MNRVPERELMRKKEDVGHIAGINQTIHRSMERKISNGGSERRETPLDLPKTSPFPISATDRLP
jgi:hypothetical protein